MLVQVIELVKQLRLEVVYSPSTENEQALVHSIILA